MTSRDEALWRRDAEDVAQASAESPPPTDREEPIAQVAAANQSANDVDSQYSMDFDEESDKKEEKKNLFMQEDQAESIPEEKPVARIHEREPEAKLTAESLSESIHEEEPEPVSRTDPAAQSQGLKPEKRDERQKQDSRERSKQNTEAKSNTTSSRTRPKSSRLQRSDVAHSKSSIYDTRYARFAPNHSRCASELDLAAQAERLAVPKKHKERPLPPVEAGAKTYKGEGMTQAKVDEMLERLTRLEKPATDSRRVTPEIIAQKCGIMNSFEWNGRW